MCWNIEGLKNKLYDDDFVNFLKSFDIFGLTETWSCDQTELSDVFNQYFCVFCPAKKDKKFGRPMGGVAVYLKTYIHQLVPSGISESLYKLAKLYSELIERYCFSFGVHSTIWLTIL